MNTKFLAAATMALVAPAAANAATFTGLCANTATTTRAACSTALTGGYGNSVTLNATDDASTKVKITAWQANQANNAISSAFLGAYDAGFGVTGVQDSSGGSGYHQIDNVSNYTDFVMLQFNKAVHLDGIGINAFLMGSATTTDSDFSTYNASALNQSTWNNAIDLSAYTVVPTTWSNMNGVGGTTVSSTATGFSQVWLVGASMSTTNRNDGFKLSSIIVTQQTPAVPEPATWGMMIAGFGVVGASLRRRARQTAMHAA